MISQDFIKHIEGKLEKAIGSRVKIDNYKPELGGDINEAFQLDSNRGKFFIKINKAAVFPNMFEAEAKGLSILAKKSSFIIPKALIVGEFQNNAYLLLEYLSLERKGNWSTFGEQLARMHMKTSDKFGLDHSNYIGSLVQENGESSDWADFYMEQRLLPLSIKANEYGLLDKGDLKKLESLHKQISSIYPMENPSLLHGDLWGGNASFCKGQACIYDPAVYYGHREMDLAMTLLFGGFTEDMYDAYNEVFPLEKKWRDRIEISQLYPLLVHTNLFGGSYANQVKAILKKY